jgi:hypothetical protein
LGEVVVPVADMRAARSSYLAWDSRGSWPKRLNANGAAVDVGNREEKEDEEEEVEEEVEVTEAISEGENGIYGILLLLWCVGCRGKMRACEGPTSSWGLYLCTLMGWGGEDF